MSQITSGWYKLYRPKTIDKYIFQSDFDKEKFLSYIGNQDFPDLLLAGHRGTGKTTLGHILKEELNIPDTDFLVLNAADDNSVDDIRQTVKPFINTLSFGKFKIVFFDEADSLTPQAQDALKSMMEDESRNARFILTCNKPHKITPEIRSRCTEYTFNSMDRKSMKAIAMEILVDQGLNVDGLVISELNAILDMHLELKYPDLRKFLTSIEKHYSNGVLSSPIEDEKNLEFLVEMLMRVDENNWLRIRDIIYEDISTDDIESVYKFLDKNLNEIEKFNDNVLLSKAYVILAHYVALHDTVAIPELNLTACMIKLCQLGE